MLRDWLSTENRSKRDNTVMAVMLLAAIVFFSSSYTVEMIPNFSAVESPLFQLFHGSSDLIALGIILFTAHRLGTRTGITGAVVYLALHLPYSFLQFPNDMPELLRILFTILVTFVGIWLIKQRDDAETKLKLANDDLETAQRLTKIGNWKWDIPSGKVIWSKGLRLVNGWDMQKPPPPFAEMSSFYTPDSWKKLNEAVTKAFSTGESYDLEVDLIRTDGRQIKTRTRGEANVDSKGKMIDLHGSIQDITDSKRAEEQIRHMANMLMIIRNINQLITREKDSEKLIQQCCEFLLERQSLDEVWILLFDTEVNKVAGGSNIAEQECSAFLEELKAGRYPECLMQVLAPGKRFIAQEKPGKLHHGCVMADIHSSKDTFRSKLEYEGRIYGVIGISGKSGISFDAEERDLLNELAGDISFALENIRQEKEREAAEKARRISEENFRHSVDDSPLGIRILDTKGETVYANMALLEMYGFSSFEELNSTPSHRIYTPNAYIEHRKRVEKRNRGEYVPSRYQISIVRRDGKVRHLEVLRKDVIWNGTLQFQQLYQDITELKTLQEQLIVQDRLVSIGQLVSGVAHELNNPLTSVIGFSELLLQQDLPDGIRSDLTIVSEEAKRTSAIVKNLLTFARQQPQEKMPIRITEPLQTVLLLRRHEQNVNSVTVNTNFDPVLPLVMANTSQLQQVFFNIVTNAEFAMTEAHNKGRLSITAQKSRGYVEVAISDDGPGITPENMKRLFSPFFTTKELGKGTGLGLSICQGIVAEHGGRIWAESEIGRGATFKIELPAYDLSQQDKKIN